MKFFLWYSASLFIIALFTGCGASVHTGSTCAVSAPPVKVTRTVTETVKTERPVPVFQTQTVISTNTKSFDNTGKAVAPLHEAKVITPNPVPEPGATR